jgi:flagellar assembly protein FliH
MSRILKRDSEEADAARGYLMGDVLQWGKLAGRMRRSFESFSSRRDSTSPSEFGRQASAREGGSGRENIMETAEEKADRIEREAYEKGFAEGERAGREVGEKRLSSAAKTFVDALGEVERFKGEVLEGSERKMVDLALAVAKKIVQCEPSLKPEMILGVIREALDHSVDREHVTVRLNSSDMALVRDHCPDILASVEGLKNLTLEEDPTVSRGGVIVATDYGDVDARLEAQIAEIEKAFRAIVPQAKNEADTRERS